MIMTQRSAGALSRSLLAGVLLVLALALTACSLGSSPSGPAATPTPAVSISSFVTAQGIGDKNAPQNPTTSFSSGSTVYAVAQVSRLPQGTRLFARWSANGTVKEDTAELTADRDYSDTYVEFHISGTQSNLATGSWTVQLFVNGNPGPQTAFQIQ